MSLKFKKLRTIKYLEMCLACREYCVAFEYIFTLNYMQSLLDVSLYWGKIFTHQIDKYWKQWESTSMFKEVMEQALSLGDGKSKIVRSSVEGNLMLFFKGINLLTLGK